MRIKAIRAHEFGLFAAPVAVEGLSGGLDVLSGPNELGKSTLLEVLKAAFLRRHTTTAVRDLAPYDGGQPLVEIDFETGPAEAAQYWRITKRFSTSSRQRLAELVRLDAAAAPLRGPAAEDALSQLIGVSSDDPGRLGLLFVEQADTIIRHRDRDKDKEMRLPSGAGAIEAAIAREISAVAAGSNLRRVREAVQARLDAEVTRRGAKKHSAYAEAQAQHEALSARLARARELQRQMSDRLDLLARLRDRRDELDQTAPPEKLDAALAAAETALRTARQAEMLHSRAAATARDAAICRQDLARFDGALQQLADLAEADRSDREALAQAQVLADAGRERAARQHAERERAAARVHQLYDLARLRGVVDGQTFQRVRLGELRVSYAEAERLTRIHNDAAAARAATPATAERMRGIEESAHAIAVIEAGLAAKATTVEIAYADGADGSIRADGQALPGGQPVPVDGTLTLDIPGIGRLEIKAGETDAAAHRRGESRLADERARLASSLAALGAAGIDEARAMRAAWLTADRTAADAEASLQALAPAGLAALADEVQALIAQLTDGSGGPAAAAGDDLPTAAEIAEQISVAEQHLACSEASAVAAQHEVVSLTSASERLAARLGARAQERERLETDLPLAAVRSEERHRLAAAAATAETVADAAARAARTVSEQAPAVGEIERLIAVRDAAERTREQQRQERQDLATGIVRIEAQLAEALDASDGERPEEIEGALEAAKAALHAVETEIAGLKLLADEIDAVEAEARARYLAPVTERLAPGLAQLFGDAQLIFGDGLAVTGVSRQGRKEAISRLSGGTREQIAVLTRLAFARLLADTGEPAPLVLDDPLIFADDGRLARMFALLADAARHHQIIVLTCRAESFARLGGRRVSLTHWPLPVDAAAE